MPTRTNTGPITDPITGPGLLDVGDVELWVDQRGSGPDVLLIAGLSDPAEAWTFQLDGLAGQYRLTAFDNRGAGRSPLPPDGFSVTDMADDAAALLRAAGIERAHVAGFSGGAATAQHLALRHPDLVRSLVLVSTWARPDAYLRRAMEVWTWLPEVAPSERSMLESFLLWIYTPRAHESGMVDADHRGRHVVPVPAVAGGLRPPARGVEAARHARPPPRDHRPDDGGGGRDRHRHAAPLRAGRRRWDPGRDRSSCCPARPTSRSRRALRRSTPWSTRSGRPWSLGSGQERRRYSFAASSPMAARCSARWRSRSAPRGWLNPSPTTASPRSHTTYRQIRWACGDNVRQRS